MSSPVVVDCAGAAVGGAARFLKELDAWLASSQAKATVIGRGEPLNALWLARRELRVARRAKRVALNNVSFVGRGGTRTVLLRNALHFAASSELKSMGYTLPRSLRAQVPIVRRAAQRADVVIVPCTAMAERVCKFVPALEERIIVRPHPVAQRPWAGENPDGADLLMPILNAPYKRLPWHLARVLAASTESGRIHRVHVTARAEEFPPELRRDPRVNFVGALDAAELDTYWRASRAVYFPTQLESFGYPLAEARASGRHIVAVDTPQNREIAGPALAGFSPDSVDSLAAALDLAMCQTVTPDRRTFDPSRYFEWLLAAPDDE
jgi:glycosyltransferase involved in cell wall biosynthesis